MVGWVERSDEAGEQQQMAEEGKERTNRGKSRRITIPNIVGKSKGKYRNIKVYNYGLCHTIPISASHRTDNMDRASSTRDSKLMVIPDISAFFLAF